MAEAMKFDVFIRHHRTRNTLAELVFLSQYIPVGSTVRISSQAYRVVGVASNVRDKPAGSGEFYLSVDVYVTEA